MTPRGRQIRQVENLAAAFGNVWHGDDTETESVHLMCSAGRIRVLKLFLKGAQCLQTFSGEYLTGI